MIHQTPKGESWPIIRSSWLSCGTREGGSKWSRESSRRRKIPGRVEELHEQLSVRPLRHRPREISPDSLRLIES